MRDDIGDMASKSLDLSLLQVRQYIRTRMELVGRVHALIVIAVSCNRPSTTTVLGQQQYLCVPVHTYTYI